MSEVIMSGGSGPSEVFKTLSAVDVSDKKEQKNKLDYLSWVWAWSELKKRYAASNFEVIKNPEGLNYHTDGRTCWVEVAVIVNGITHTEMLPVMDYRNQSIPHDKVTSMDVNKAIKRCLTKCIALHGLGLYIYAGEDLPEDAAETAPAPAAAPKPVEKFLCTKCGEVIKPVSFKGEEFPVRRIAQISTDTYGSPMCWDCMRKAKEEIANAE